MYQKEKKLNPVLLIVLAVVLLAVGIAVWFLLTHVRVAGTFYSRSAEVLDLRFADITTADYEKLRKKAPNSEILWRIPFQGKTYDQNTDVLYVTSLTDEDVATLDYFTQLKSVEAQECTDYAQLAALAARRPAVAVDYAVTIDGRKYDQDTAVVSVSDITDEEINLLTYLPDLTAVTAVGCETPEQMEKLRDFCQEKGISFALRFGTKTYPDTVQELDVTGITDAELELLQLLPELKTLHLVNPEADPATVLQLRSTYPKVSINWEVEMAGISFPDDTKEVDLSAALEITTTDKTTTQTAATTKVTTGTVTGTQTTEEPKPAVTLDLQDLEKKMSYLPDADWLPDWMRVEQLVEMFREFYADFDPAKANEMLARLELEPKARLKTLSKGSKEKVQLILAMSRAAKLYLLDEPIGGVDPAARDYILSTILNNYSRDATVILSTHLIGDIEPILDEAVFLKDGRVFAHRNAEELRETEGMSVDAYFREVFKC